MKKILVLLSVVLLLISCEDKEKSKLHLAEPSYQSIPSTANIKSACDSLPFLTDADLIKLKVKDTMFIPFNDRYYSSIILAKVVYNSPSKRVIGVKHFNGTTYYRYCELTNKP